MSGPVRLREGGSALERELTSSSAVDVPTEGAKNRAFAALGITAVGVSALPVAAAAAKRAFFGIHISSSVKIVGVIAVASAAAVGGYEMHTHRAAEIRVEQPQPMLIPAPTTSADPILPSPIAIDPAPSSSASAKPIAAPAASGSTPRPHHDDSAELSWIDRAQSALKNDPARALEIVDAYRQTVSPRAFDEEASVIAIEASERTGDAARARHEADQFFVTYPHSAYRSKVDALLEN